MKSKDLLNKAAEVDESEYTAESYGVLKAAVADAKAVFANAEATEADVKAAEEKLENALDGLVLTDAGETPEEPTNPEEKPEDKPNNPNTDDAIPYAVPMALVLAAGAVFIIRKRAIKSLLFFPCFLSLGEKQQAVCLLFFCFGKRKNPCRN